MKKPRSSAATESVLHRLHRLSQLSDELFAAKAAALGLTARQFVVLSVVSEIENPSQTLLCHRTGIDRSTLSEIVARLVARGLLMRKRSRLDNRKYAVRLTDTGQKIYESAVPVALEADAILLRTLTPAERVSLLHILGRLLEGEKA